VATGKFGGGLAFTATTDRAKYRNLARNTRFALMICRPDWRGYAVIDGDAEVRSAANTDPALLSADLRDVYRAASSKEHPNWGEYDEAMRTEGRVVVVVLRPGRLLIHNLP